MEPKDLFGCSLIFMGQEERICRFSNGSPSGIIQEKGILLNVAVISDESMLLFRSPVLFR
jgi:hypothetical protein